MKLQPTTILGIVIATAALFGGGYYIYNSISGVPGVPVVSEDEDKTQTIVISPDGTIEDGDGYTVEIIPIEDSVPSIPAPDLDRAIVFYTDMPEEAKIIMRERINVLTSTLKDNSNQLSKWLSLGIQWKSIGDYEGAREAWEYASALRPSNNISFLNLGDLYHYYLKDFPKAEENLRTSIKNNPTYVQVYVRLHDLYKYSYKQDTSSAVDILNEGLQKIPNNVDLLVTMALYYKVNDDAVNARVYYTKARDEALKRGDTARAELLEQELSAL